MVPMLRQGSRVEVEERHSVSRRQPPVHLDSALRRCAGGWLAHAARFVAHELSIHLRRIGTAVVAGKVLRRFRHQNDLHTARSRALDHPRHILLQYREARATDPRVCVCCIVAGPPPDDDRVRPGQLAIDF